MLYFGSILRLSLSFNCTGYGTVTYSAKGRAMCNQLKKGMVAVDQTDPHQASGNEYAIGLGEDASGRFFTYSSDLQPLFSHINVNSDLQVIVNGPVLCDSGHSGCQ